ncbi:MAG: DUF3102 domain-containing protein [Eubacteriales bacterium]|nr:DUF3102 domain-containing protein [Eubacteriales bacterium]MDD4513755.1 DUF3102 domain-containing protein [Eubacteriales bacterium]
MSEITTTNSAELVTLDTLAAEARVFSENMARNMIQLGRVYTEAKKLVKHGEWTNWIRENGGMSERSAQQLMAIYSRFGERPAFQSIEKSKLFKMLSLPAGTEDDFAEQNDLESMSSREVEEAVKRTKEEMQQQIDAEREKREAAEAREAAIRDNPPLPDDIAQALQEKDEKIKQYQGEIERVGETSRDLMDEAARLRREKEQLAHDLSENNELLAEVQEQCDRVQAEYLNMQSTLAKGDAERVPSDELTADVFATAVRQFIGTVARMPHMGRVFGSMTFGEKELYGELLSTVESWARDARKALDTIESEVFTL